MVEPSSAPRDLDSTGAAAAASRSDLTLRRRNKDNSNAGSVVEPSPAPRGLDSTGAASRPEASGRRKDKGGSSSNNTAPTQRPRTQAATDATSSSAAPVAASNNNKLRTPLERYLLLSVMLVAAGLGVRFLWRQLAGLVGAALILSAARRWSGAPAVRKPPPDAPPSAAALGAPVSGGDQTVEATASSAADCETAGDRGGAAAAAGGEETGRREGDVVGDGGGTCFADAPAELRRFWKDGGPGCQFLVRGPKYISDRKKIPAGPAAMRLVHVDFFSVEGEVFHVASKGRCRDRVSAFLKSYEDKGEAAPFLFILNILVPGNPVVATVMYLALDQTTQRRDGVGLGEEGVSSPVPAGGGDSARHDTFLAMLARYAEVPGSGYNKLERTRSPSSPSPPPCISISSSSSSPLAPTAASTSVSSSSSASPPPLSSCAPPPTPSPHPREEERQPRQEEDASSSSSSSSPLPLAGVAGLEGGNGPPAAEGAAGAGAEALSTGAASRGGGLGGAPADRNSDPAGLLPVDDFRNQRFKLIPSVVSGPFIVRKAVGNKPALLGRKVSQRYFRGPGYVETDVDVGSSMIAEKIVSLCRGYAKALTVELGICLEGRCDEELPETVMGVIRLVNVDIDMAEPLHRSPSSPRGRGRGR
ncbi:conserved unknown protein [Ectocarpus siliculosus]|uniref:Protein ENHANCED DISEASE RESISTANCE 2 C-terminal domain-containing protein n=1 Tax=Ectocarpus siliculosus TaxID=2880 RepID=D7G1Z5_ECTSI|nr:conserved unknown protein [Ectocarpus siliculosus]|eukprot:CBJ48721.1 conserved unknown protein [Ectocarpus siliculosus]